MLALAALSALAAMPASLDALLDAPVKTLRADHVPRGFWPIVASNIAEGCASLPQPEATSCIERTVDLALDPLVTGWSTPPRDLGGDGLRLAHLGVVLASYEHITGDPRHDALRARLATHLARRSLADPTKIMSSYAGTPQRYPADQAVLLHFLALHDELEGTFIAVAPTSAFLATMVAEGTDPSTELWVSERTGAEVWSNVPRGCAATYTSRYLALAAPAAAQSQWDLTLEHLGTRQYGLLGIREWPVDRTFPGDNDSGPIVMGIGAAATGFGIGAADRLDDHWHRRALQNTEAMVRSMAPWAGPEVEAAANSVLGASLTFGNTAGPWWNRPRAAQPDAGEGR